MKSISDQSIRTLEDIATTPTPEDILGNLGGLNPEFLVEGQRIPQGPVPVLLPPVPVLLPIDDQDFSQINHPEMESVLNWLLNQ